MWPKLCAFWHEALKGKARDLFGLPGMALAHGYLPPTVPDPWYVENQCLDYTIDSFGQVAKVIWDLWDYQGDETFLREQAYPVIRDLAIFYEAFARVKGAALLGVDADWIDGWKEVAGRLPRLSS